MVRGRTEEALRYYKKALALDPLNADLRRQVGRLQGLTGGEGGR